MKRESALVKFKCSGNHWPDVPDEGQMFQKWKKLQQLFIITLTSPRGDWDAIVYLINKVLHTENHSGSIDYNGLYGDMFTIIICDKQTYLGAIVHQHQA
jgi:hypothetical protein